MVSASKGQHPAGTRRVWAALALVVAVAGCKTAGQPAPGGGVAPQPAAAPQGTASVAPQGATGETPADQARDEIAHPRYTAAGVEFTSGMIGHHAQAILMSQWAPTHGASPAIQSLAERIIVSQTDEIKFMQDWLRARHQVVPPSDPRGYVMPGMSGPMLMPGMLTPEQMAALDHARGADFDRLFLADMIMHHRGAIGMVQKLTSSADASTEDDALMTYAANVAADQAAEVGRMGRMLNSEEKSRE